MRKQALCSFGDSVFYARRDFWIYDTSDVAIFLECAEGHGQHFLRYVRDFALQFFEPYGAPFRIEGIENE